MQHGAASLRQLSILSYQRRYVVMSDEERWNFDFRRTRPHQRRYVVMSDEERWNFDFRRTRPHQWERKPASRSTGFMQTTLGTSAVGRDPDDVKLIETDKDISSSGCSSTMTLCTTASATFTAKTPKCYAERRKRRLKTIRRIRGKARAL